MLSILFLQLSGKLRKERIKPVLKCCCISRSPFSAMSFLTFLFLTIFYIISKETGTGVALVHNIPPNSAGPFSLLFSTGTGLAFFTPKNFSKTILASKLTLATQVDYFVNANHTEVFWYDAAQKKIFKAHSTETGVHNITVIVSRGVVDVKDMAIDRFSQHLYWLDFHYKRIEVSRLDGTLRTTLLTNVTSSGGMSLDAESGFLFWSSESRIEKSYLNGQGRMPVVEHLNSPFVFALDCHHKSIYWTDRSGSLHKTDYEGRNHSILGKSEALASVYSLSIYNGTVYWTDSIHQTVNKAEVKNSSQVDVLTVAYPQLYGMKVFHPTSSQVMIRSQCLFANGGCSHLCLTGPEPFPTCQCPYGLQLMKDNKTCTDHGPILGYARKEAEVHNVYFVDLLKPDQWIFPPLTIDASTNNSLAADVQREEVYWISGKRILKQSAGGHSVSKVIYLGYFEPQVLAFDWVSRNLYMFLLRGDNERGVLSVASPSGEFFTHLHWKDIYEPGLMSVDSENKILLWSHTRVMAGKTVHYIELSSVNGQGRKMLFLSDSHVPNALITDAVGKQACWVARNDSTVRCLSYDGSRQSTLSLNKSTGITAMSSFNGSLFYSIGNGSIKALDLTSSHNEVHVKNTSSVSFLSVFSSTNFSDPCAQNNGNCSGLCLTGNRKMCKMQYDQPFLLYITESSEPHSICLTDIQAPERFPSPIFISNKGDSVDFFSGNRTSFFWISHEKNIYSAFQDGSYEKMIVEAEFAVTGLAVDWIAENLYWSVAEKSMIWVSRLTGEFPYIVAYNDVHNPTSLAVHPVLGLLFWKECTDVCEIKRSTLSGKQQHVLVTSVPHLDEIAIDVNDGLLYWLSANGLESSDVHGKRRTVVISTATASPISFAVTPDSFYWIDSTFYSGSVMKKSKSNNNFVILKNISMSQKLLYISKDAQEGTNPCNANNGGCEHLCLFEGNHQFSCQCSYSSLSLDKKTCTGDQSYVMVANRNTIDSIRGDERNDPNPPKRPIIPHASIRNIVSLCYQENVIYFSDLYQQPFLFSIQVDGKNFQPILKDTTVIRQIEGIAYENQDQLLLWTDSVTPSIWQYSFVLGQEKILFPLRTSDKPRGIAVASPHRKLFWTNWNVASPKIETAFLNGSNHRTLLLSTLGHPNGLTVDGDDLYWTDANEDISYWISSCKLDGSNTRILYAGTGGHPFDIAVIGKFVLWTDWEVGAVWKIHKYGPPDIQLVQKNLTKPLGLVTIQRAPSELKGYDSSQCGNKCIAKTRTKDLKKSCSGAMCDNIIAIQVQEHSNVSFQTKIYMYISITVVASVILMVLLFVIRRKYKRKKWVKNNVWQIYKPRLHSTDSDRLTLDAIVANRMLESDCCSQRKDDRVSLITEET